MIKFVTLKTHDNIDVIINLDAIDTVFPDNKPNCSVIKLRYDDVRDEESFIYVPYSVKHIIEILKVKSLCASL